MEQTLVLKYRFPGMNDLIDKNRNSYHSGANMKRKWTNVVTSECYHQKLKPFKKLIDVTFIWTCKDRRRDKDNITAAQKFIFDGLVNSKVIKNDGWHEVGDICHKFILGKTDKVEVVMEERFE